MTDLVNELWESDQASALTNQAARRIEELQAELKALANTSLGRIADLELALSEISALRAEDHDKAGYIAVAALNKDEG